MSLQFRKPSRAVQAGKGIFLVLAGAILLSTVSGCASSVSGSISDSVSSPFEWSSDSSGSSSEEREEAYRNDIRDYTDAYVRSNSDAEGLRAGISSVAGRHGVTDWEADAASYLGIGAGLAKAKASREQVVQYASVLADGDAQRDAVERGYRSVQ